MIFSQVTFLKSAAKVSQLPQDTGVEVAFAGRSNAGKSSAINCLTGIKQLARASKTPGRTRLINCFILNDPKKRLIDLPGYGYAKVSQAMQAEWQRHLAHYFEVRQSLKGLVLLMDVRHPLMPLDQSMLNWAIVRHLPVHILLTKADKLSKSQAQQTLWAVKKQVITANNTVSIQLFSSLNRLGLDHLSDLLCSWYA